MDYSTYLNKITIDNLNPQHKKLANSIGMDNFIKLVGKFGGGYINIPKQQSIVKTLAYSRIRKEYDGKNIKDLAVKYDVSERTVYKIINGEV